MIADVAQLAFGFAGRVDLHIPLGVAIFGLSVLMLLAARGLRAGSTLP
jgi:hypothetical protein